MDLLPAAPTIGLERNRRLDELAAMVREDASLAQALESRVGAAKKSKFMTMLDDYVAEFGNLTGTDRPESDAGALTIRLVIELAGRPPIEDRGRGSRRHELEQEFFDAFPEERKQFAADLLDLARASYRWRDDDNIYLRRIEAELSRAIGLLQARPGRRQVSPYPEADNAAEDRPAASRRPFDRKLRDAPSESDRSRSTGQREASSMGEHARGRLRAQARQLTGQPAGPGIATGKARVIGTGNLFEFRAGEIIVCDAIEPEMTFIVPLAAAIVERRGGMLIHGAIIAREYGIPCVTGVPDATRLIGTGDSVTVDGYLGIVVLEGPAPAVSSNR
jgi:pyruvate,water dikinase